MPRNNLRHGMNKTRFHKLWLDMKGRCYTKSKTAYKYYGGRGIKVEQSWHIFENFRDDMLETYNNHIKKYGERQTTLDRIDVNKGYSKNNCKWSTYIEQANNRTDNHFITINNEKKSLIMWSRLKGINAVLVANRINRLGWTPEKALTEPKRIFLINN